jgi:hypothetical protein
MPDHPAPLPAGVPGWERIGPDLDDDEPTRRRTLHDLAGPLDGGSVVDAFAPLSDPKLGGFSRS